MFSFKSCGNWIQASWLDRAHFAGFVLGESLELKHVEEKRLSQLLNFGFELLGEKPNVGEYVLRILVRETNVPCGHRSLALMDGMEQRRIGFLPYRLGCEVCGIRPKEFISIAFALRAVTAGAMLDVDLFSLCHPIRPRLRARVSIAGHHQREVRHCDGRHHSHVMNRDINKLPCLLR
jgi:hypothetical protein